jgi:hypothetical protein
VVVVVLAEEVVVALGLLTALYGNLVWRVQSDVKSALAFASMTQVGLMVAEGLRVGLALKLGLAVGLAVRVGVIVAVQLGVRVGEAVTVQSGPAWMTMACSVALLMAAVRMISIWLAQTMQEVGE